MSRLPILAPLLLLPGIAVAQIIAPDCSLTWKWTFNSLGQNACTVAAYLMASCNGGSWEIVPLSPGSWYTVFADERNLCICNTVTYSLLSACGACQLDTWTTWSLYSYNCTKTMPVSSGFPALVLTQKLPPVSLTLFLPEHVCPNGLSLMSQFVAQFSSSPHSPELTPGMLIPPSNASSTSPTPTPTPSTTPSPTPTTPSPTPTTPSPTPTTPSPTPTHRSSSNAGATAGGVIGGVAAIAVAGLAIFFWLRRKRSHAPSAASVADGAPQSLVGEVRPPGSDDGTHGPSSMPGTPATPMKLYDPNDPTTFPGFQGAGQVYTEVPVAPYSGNTQTNMQTSPPQGYHGFPTV
ncbi:hypothetical protein BJV78DRAFT_1154793 [Lactifluus subvellereus]|nr:hypothetical protein BJV78DRAFT_1154793 [Lactifluus subvellereus]